MRDRARMGEERAHLKQLDRDRQKKQASSTRTASQPVERQQALAQQPEEETRKDKVLSRKSSDERPPLTFWESFKKQRELREKILAERTAMDASVTPTRQRSNRPSEFGVGSDADHQATKPGSSTSTKLRPLKSLFRKVMELRLPQWALATTPVLFLFIYWIIPTITEHVDRGAVTAKKFQSQLDDFIKQNQWNEAQIASNRIFRENVVSENDIFNYFDVLTAVNKQNAAWNLLYSQEQSWNEANRGRFNYRFGKKIVESGLKSQNMVNAAVFRLKEALKYRLSEADELDDRRLLGRLMIAIGEGENAYRVLEPIQSKNESIASEALILKFMLKNEDLNSSEIIQAQRMLESINQRMANSNAISDEDLASRIGFLCLLDREPEARAWLAGLENKSPEEIAKWSRVINEFALSKEIRKPSYNEQVVWSKLEPLLKSEPENTAFSRVALAIWAKTPDPEKSPAFEWVSMYLKSGKASTNFLQQAAFAGHNSAKWDLVRPVYGQIVERDPKNIVALNNLASILYKFPPYDYPKALELIDRALTIQPGMPALVETKGQILARLNRLDEAKQLLESSLTVAPTDWNIHNTLAQIYAKQGYKLQAQAHADQRAKVEKPMNAPLESVITSLK